MVDKENNPFDFMSLCVRNEIAHVFAKLDVSSSGKYVPDDFLSWPEEGDETVHSFVVAECWDVDGFSFFRPTSLDFGEEFSPFFVLET